MPVKRKYTRKRKLYSRNRSMPAFMRKRIRTKYLQMKKRRSARARRIKAALNPEVKQAPIYTNADSTIGENPTDSRVFTIYNTSTGGAYPSTWPLQTQLNLITQGDEQSNRDGNRITIKKWTARITVRQNNAEPIMYRMFIGRPKAIASATTSISNASWTQLLQQGNTATAPLSTYLSYQMPVNRDYWAIKVERKFVLAETHSESDGLGNPDFALHAGSRNYPEFKVFNIDLTKFFPKTIIYDDTTASPRNAKGLFVFFQACTFGSQADHSAVTPEYNPNVDIVQSLEFYDN